MIVVTGSVISICAQVQAIENLILLDPQVRRTGGARVAA
jgi:hypothetical protein